VLVRVLGLVLDEARVRARVRVRVQGFEILLWIHR
jgi:hypothetical protein